MLTILIKIQTVSVLSNIFCWQRNSHAYGTYWPSFQSPFLENMMVVLYNKGYQMIELLILLQLIQVLRPGSNLIHFHEDQKEVGVRTSISHKYGMIHNFKLKWKKNTWNHCIVWWILILSVNSQTYNILISCHLHPPFPKYQKSCMTLTPTRDTGPHLLYQLPLWI